MALEPFDVESPWWPDVEPVVAAAATGLGVDVTVLRLIDATPDPHDRSGMAGAVTYLTEVSEEAHATLVRRGLGDAWHGDLDDHPLRASWARPGGPAGHLAWADAALVELGRPRIGPAGQVKTWNLSGIWRLPTEHGPVWLKTVPPFFAHEGRTIAALGDAPVPPLLAADDGRALFDDVPGEDQWTAAPAVLQQMVALLVDLQSQWIGHSSQLLDLGLADFRAPALALAAASVFDRVAGRLPAAERRSLDALIRGLDRRFAAVAACGLPDTLVHGDFHPGNVRGIPGALVILDWGDCGVGHPLLDLESMLERVADKASLRSAWTVRWQHRVPGCDPRRAAELLGPVGPLRRATVYQTFLEGIEPFERRYHAADVAAQLLRSAACSREPDAAGDRPDPSTGTDHARRQPSARSRSIRSSDGPR